MSETGHTMRIDLDYENIQLTPECHEPPGSICRVVCPEECESFDHAHEHGLVNIDYCNAVEGLTNGDVECCCEDTGKVPLRDGMSIGMLRDGDHYTWKPTS